MTELDPDLKSLLQRAKSELSPTPNDEARLAARLEGARHHAGSPAPAGRPWGTGMAGLALGLGLGTALGYHLATRGASSHELDVRPVSVATLENTSPLEAPPSAKANVALSLDLPTVTTSKHVTVATTPTPDPIPSAILRPHKPNLVKDGDAGGNGNRTNVDEIEQVRRVRRALAQQDPSLALLLLDELDRTVPKGRLMQERDAGRAIARCIQEPRSRAATRAAFERQHPSSVHQTRVSQACKE